MMESNTNKGNYLSPPWRFNDALLDFRCIKLVQARKTERFFCPAAYQTYHSRHAPLSLYGGERIITILDDTSSLFGMSQCTHMNNQLATKGWWRFADNSVPRLNWNFVTCHVVQSHGAQLILTTYDIKKKHTHTHWFTGPVWEWK